MFYYHICLLYSSDAFIVISMETAIVSSVKKNTGDTSDKNNYRIIALVLQL